MYVCVYVFSFQAMTRRIKTRWMVAPQLLLVMHHPYRPGRIQYVTPVAHFIDAGLLGAVGK